jgi:hypothetical protein
MPKNKEDSGSDSEKNDSGSGSEGEEEEYVVEKVVDKRTTKNGKVCIENNNKQSASNQISRISPLRSNISSNGRAMTHPKTHGSRRRISTVLISSKNSSRSERKKKRFEIGDDNMRQFV